jgi:putative ABC transport system permease protein
MLHNMRLALRSLAKQPGFALITVLTLALGIGATSAVFSLIQGVLLTPPPYRQPERLVLIESARADGQKTTNTRNWAALQWQGWQQEAKSFEAIAAYNWSFNYLVLPDGSESLEGMVVTQEYFKTMGLQPILGRTFVEAETGGKRPPVIILGHDLWQRKFNGDPNIIGKTIRISRFDTPPTVIGVMPPGVRFLPSPGASQEPNYNVNALVDFWFPVTPNPARLKNAQWDVVGRLRAGVTPPQAQAELNVIVARQALAERDFQGVVAHLNPLSDELNHDGRRILLPLLGASALVLLIACGNAAALLLVRGLQRQQEYAVRSALGCGRIALFRQVSMESLLLSLIGGGVGVGLAFGIVKLFKVIGGHAIPRLDAVTTGWPVLACGLASAVLASLIAGIFPALRASRLDPIHVLKSAGPKSSAGRGERRILRAVTMAQTALTLALLVGAGLLIRTMMRVSKVQSGYDTGHLLTMSVTAVNGNWADFHHRALERVSALPGVQGAGFAWGVPLTGNSWGITVEIEGQPAPSKESDRLSIPSRAVTPGYFKLLGLTISEGRDVRDSDSGKVNVAIVNQAFADRFFPHGAMGKKLSFFGQRDAPVEIVGVVRNSRTEDLTQAASPEIYLSLWQASAFSKTLVVRTAADPRAVLVAVQRAIYSVDPTAAVENVKTMEQIRGDSLASRTFAMQLLVGFSAVGSALTLIGIYGVLSLSVASRRREIAIRSAVGAERRDIRNLIFADGFRLIAGGVISGLAAAVILSRVLRSFLFEVEPTDPLTLIAVAVLFSGVALMACWVPTRRAAGIDPLEALRYE